MEISIVPEDFSEPESRADKVLLAVIQKREPSFSRGRLKDLFQLKQIFWRGKPIVASVLLPQGNHVLELRDLALTDFETLKAAVAPSAFVPILYEDDAVLILNKPSGTPSAPQSADEINTAVNSVLASHPELAAVGKNPLDAGLVHRLDTGTSGALLFAKTMAEYERLKLLFKQKRVFKLYRALVQNKPEFTTPHRIDWALGHDLNSKKRMLVLRDPTHIKRIRGKSFEAITLIHKVQASPKGHDLQIEIQTGVMHQIRAHLASVGIPIVGDPVYGGAESSRLWLHAWKLTLPREGKSPLEITAPLPENW